MCYFIKPHGDSEVPPQVKISDLDQTYIEQMRKLRSGENYFPRIREFVVKLGPI